MIDAAGLGLRTRQGWVYRGVDLSLPAGSLAVIAGPAGSGRTMSPLTLAGRAKPSTDELRVGDALVYDLREWTISKVKPDLAI